MIDEVTEPCGSARARFFVVYGGPSMYPTLRESELVEIVPYGCRPVQVGDVILFLPPGATRPVVHRVVRSTGSGMATRGDNNPVADRVLLQPGDIRGRVVAAWRGQRRRAIAGGLGGRCAGRLLSARRDLGRRLSRLLQHLVPALLGEGVWAAFVPASLRPRVVVFRAEGRVRARLFMGGRVVGHRDARTHVWTIRRPFRLFVDTRALPRCLDSPGGEAP